MTEARILQARIDRAMSMLDEVEVRYLALVNRPIPTTADDNSRFRIAKSEFIGFASGRALSIKSLLQGNHDAVFGTEWDRESIPEVSTC